MTQYWDWIEAAADGAGYGGLYDSSANVLAKLGIGSGHVLLRLGDFSFTVTAAVHQELSRQTDFDWQVQRRLMRAPARQFVGMGDDAFTLPGVIYPEYMGGVAQMDKIRAMGRDGVPYLLVNGMGQVLGEFCILSVSETHTAFDAFGRPKKIDFSISIAAYGNDYGDSDLTEVDVVDLLKGLF
ncbi:hypothetical protein DTO96_102393 [Ephemeroptericola cinctiostellae]|uniref:Phage tail protein n=1 Tax=Ephemeroptericola cinctiostellae TaxID=2268024 RepID=A0A345DE50_9BURK|nr:phage tail protein [Ephemeroptericola cinctiostellae]AXF86638.1 hypothetical protein DTO96_102393 [Ephemeroptericola cinctiostellae]